ncbi:PREDICTED: lecithin retinol acyltransferase-like [Priapulus caudatus]|uniref:Lecithin retinol acyltransferase-like n=1 Tax=Priapulus caudatus TaxID=37621 RepID=A0ABM1DST2_PRICU|nr:PREDICTED: lecithin retinol acyltransferase-like [Priapulus caudatus]
MKMALAWTHGISPAMLEPADHIYVWRCGYSHHGIWTGSEVIHYAPPNSSNIGLKSGANVRKDPLDRFLQNGALKKYLYGVFEAEWFLKVRGTCSVKESCPAELVLKRAEDMIGQSSYDFVENNCEHFALWCKLGHRAIDVPNQASSTVLNIVSALATPVRSIALVLLSVLDDDNTQLLNNTLKFLVTFEHRYTLRNKPCELQYSQASDKLNRI